MMNPADHGDLCCCCPWNSIPGESFSLTRTTVVEVVIPANMNQDQTTTKPRRKKATRACSHCQKAHLTCDDSRPCQRCIKRGLESTCTDGTRKRAKYLQDDEYSKSASPAASTPSEPQSLSASFDQQRFNPGGFDPQLINIGNDYGFGSESANLEYGVLSNMLQLNGVLDQQQPQQQPQSAISYLGHTFDSNTSDMVMMRGNNSPSMASASSDTASPRVTHPTAASPLDQLAKNKTIKRRKGVGSTPEETYTRIKAPFNYAEGYHYLFQHVRRRMGQDELMRISRALAMFRPSFISTMVSLTEEDLIYMEKCVQRTLMEYEKLISFSGTPTAVWRRTGEIVLVGKEFSLLTQWSKEALLDKKTFIYELMDNGSVIEYWEKYGEHAFSDTESSVYMSVILMSPTYRPVPCSFCFTIKRDIFDLPSVVVGNFLPILSGSTL
ncbi:hypothetical pas domain protein [Lichtheimia corymbifera JMRC:FSU:9682]|uniref:Hypothetical pas domain protein n=1 Tax=Lichtheimia corymbifera JMRC:FSU:9682 TaxID=1263082 RepID=A0A068RLG4_9FUNG|nr:hypothetical pas domain protein [Lichtheimia corymbifera JMRC:FSU:9682]